MCIRDSFLSDITQLTIEDGLEWSTGSKNRKLEDVEFWMGKRSQAGKKVPKYFNKILNLINKYFYYNSIGLKLLHEQT